MRELLEALSGMVTLPPQKSEPNSSVVNVVPTGIFVAIAVSSNERVIEVSFSENEALFTMLTPNGFAELPLLALMASFVASVEITPMDFAFVLVIAAGLVLPE